MRELRLRENFPASAAQPQGEPWVVSPLGTAQPDLVRGLASMAGYVAVLI